MYQIFCKETLASMIRVSCSLTSMYTLKLQSQRSLPQFAEAGAAQFALFNSIHASSPMQILKYNLFNSYSNLPAVLSVVSFVGVDIFRNFYTPENDSLCCRKWLKCHPPVTSQLL